MYKQKKLLAHKLHVSVHMEIVISTQTTCKGTWILLIVHKLYVSVHMGIVISTETTCKCTLK